MDRSRPWERLVAGVTDTAFAILLVAAAATLIPAAERVILAVGAPVACVIYRGLCDGWAVPTAGRWLTGLRVRRELPAPLPLRVALLRQAWMLLACLGLLGQQWVWWIPVLLAGAVLGIGTATNRQGQHVLDRALLTYVAQSGVRPARS